MDVGMMILCTNYGWDDCPDAQVWDEELHLAALAADLGFDGPTGQWTAHTPKTLKLLWVHLQAAPRSEPPTGNLHRRSSHPPQTELH